MPLCSGTRGQTNLNSPTFFTYILPSQTMTSLIFLGRYATFSPYDQKAQATSNALSVKPSVTTWSKTNKKKPRSVAGHIGHLIHWGSNQHTISRFDLIKNIAETTSDFVTRQKSTSHTTSCVKCYIVLAIISRQHKLVRNDHPAKYPAFVQVVVRINTQKCSLTFRSAPSQTIHAPMWKTPYPSVSTIQTSKQLQWPHKKKSVEEIRLKHCHQGEYSYCPDAQEKSRQNLRTDYTIPHRQVLWYQ